jgi:hypothetical protein
VHERLFLRKDVPDDVFSHVLTFWRSDHRELHALSDDED